MAESSKCNQFNVQIRPPVKYKYYDITAVSDASRQRHVKSCRDLKRLYVDAPPSGNGAKLARRYRLWSSVVDKTSCRAPH